MMKSFVRVCVHRKSSEWKESSESRKSSIVVSSRWNLELEVNQDQYPCMAMKDSKPALRNA